MADALVTESPDLVVPEIPDDYVPEVSPVDPGKHVAPLQGPVDSGIGPHEDLSSMSSTDSGRYEPKIRSSVVSRFFARAPQAMLKISYQAGC